MILSGHQPNYFPYPGLLGKIMYSDKFIYVTEVQFEKKSWQNRNRIKGSNGEMLLTVPILSKNVFTQKISEVMINNNVDWMKKHFQSIHLNYKKTKFYPTYIDFFHDLYSRQWKKLIDLDLHIMAWLLNELKIETEIYYDRDYKFAGNKTPYLIDMCKALNCDTYLSNKGSENYVDIDMFLASNLNHKYINYIGMEYQQNYGDFITNLSSIDMLFNIGAIEMKRILGDMRVFQFSELNQNIGMYPT